MGAVTQSLVSGLGSSGGCCVLRRLGFVVEFSGPLLVVEVVAVPKTRPNILGWAASPCEVACHNRCGIVFLRPFLLLYPGQTCGLSDGSATHRLLDVPRYCGAVADAHETQ